VRRNSLRLRPPLRGDWWAATEGPAANDHHTASAVPFEGRMHVPQRFAIDFVRIYEDRQMFHGDRKDVRSYRSYGAQALAVADTRVAAVRDGVPDNAPDTEVTEEMLGGNEVILELGNGLFAIYAHLQPESIRVKEGDRVYAGDVLGLVGNSGALYPHLHFEVADGQTLLKNEGMPYVFESFIHDGKRVRDEIPQQSWVLTFDEIR
jgi:hypothetical protein